MTQLLCPLSPSLVARVRDSVGDRRVMIRVRVRVWVLLRVRGYG